MLDFSKKTLDAIGDYTPRHIIGFPILAEKVQKAIYAIVKNNDKVKAIKYIKESGLSKAGVLYAAIRTYMGDENEERVLMFLVDLPEDCFGDL